MTRVFSIQVIKLGKDLLVSLALRPEKYKPDPGHTEGIADSTLSASITTALARIHLVVKKFPSYLVKILFNIDKNDI